MNCDYTDPGGTPLERLTQQQAGNHPAPCARSCEANAYEIEVRRYQAEVEQFRADARRFRLAEKNLFDVQEAAKIIAKQAIAAEAERDALAAKLKDAEHDRDEFRRVMNGFAEKMAELEGQYPVFAFRRRGQTDFCTCTEGRYNELAEKPHLFEVRKLYARPVPAEPVNARLLTALKACRNKLAHDAEMVAMADVAIMAAEAAPRVARLTADELRLICDRWADEDGATGQTGRTFLARAIEAAALRKNGLALED